jgi:hypothetical protein
VFEHELREIFGPKKDEVRKQCRILENEYRVNLRMSLAMVLYYQLLYFGLHPSTVENV